MLLVASSGFPNEIRTLKKKKKNYESLALGAEIVYLIFVDLPHFLRTK